MSRSGSLAAPLAGLLLLLFGHGLVASPPPVATLGPPPGEGSTRVASLDDPVAAQKVLVLGLQNLGEARGTVVALRTLDWDRVEEWSRRLDTLDPTSDLAPALTALHFGAAARPPEARRLARLLGDLSAADPLHRWPWRVHAVYLAGARGGDTALARTLAAPLADLPPGVAPPWVSALSSAVPSLGEFSP